MSKVDKDKYYIYRFKNEMGKVIYVGRCKKLKSRLSNHSHLPYECYRETVEVEYAVVNSEVDMVLYETYYISKYRPKYNSVGLYEADDKSLILQELNFNLYSLGKNVLNTGRKVVNYTRLFESEKIKVLKNPIHMAVLLELMRLNYKKEFVTFTNKQILKNIDIGEWSLSKALKYLDENGYISRRGRGNSREIRVVLQGSGKH